MIRGIVLSFVLMLAAIYPAQAQQNQGGTRIIALPGFTTPGGGIEVGAPIVGTCGAGDIFYNNAGLFGCSTGITASNTALTLGAGSTLSGGTITGVIYGTYNVTASAPGTGYVPGDAVTPTGGTTTAIGGWSGAANFIVVETQVVTAAVNATGSSCSGSSGTLTGTTGTGTKFQVAANYSGGAVTTLGAISIAGNYSVNPTSLSAEPVTGNSCSGVTLTIAMGALGFYIQQPGFFTIQPTLMANAQNTTTGSGTGLTMNLSMAPLPVGLVPSPYDSTFPGVLGDNAYYGLRLPPTITTGHENTLFGATAGNGLTTGSGNVYIQGCELCAGASSNGTVIGNDAVRNATAIGSVTVVGNSAVKANTGSAITGNLTVFGQGALINWNNTSSNNPRITAIGDNAGAGASGATYINATIVGDTAGSALTSSNGGLVIVGRGAGTKLTTGSGTFLGDSVASTTQATGTGNIIIGVSNAADTASSSTSNFLGIFGASATALISATGINAPTTATTTIHGSTLNFPDLTNAAGNEILCYDTTGGPVTYENAVAGCVPSGEQFKNILGIIDGKAAARGIASIIQPAVYTYKDTAKFGAQEYDGMIAQQMCRLSEHLCVRDPVTHEPKNYDKVGALAFAFAAIKYQQQTLGDMESKIEKLERRLH